ncbi:cupin domain-containing protein [Hoeflea sp. G2-23]|uniref:Cupin domain-containing protein n=1 Tax=Hoeflea algicola TaxID=2983763 RepID=A0ABT3ZC92_9HYPH|nr:cupin domain-containing protein [Hoeflea algicola]MCY0149251.1 cupin domain-containing protein [Hoeflea algicola]
MVSRKQHIEMLRLDPESGWQDLPGFPGGLEHRPLANDLDEKRKTGSRTRLIRFAPGVSTEEALVHDYWEEVLLLSGDLTPKQDPVPASAETMAYCLRPPGTPHGPFISHTGCVLMEVQYYLKD